MKVVVLCSGGMDSVTALHWARREHDVVAAVSFDYGAKHNHRELPLAAEQAVRLGVRHEVIQLDFVNRLFASDLLQSGGEIPEGHYAAENMRQTVVPFRNAIMLSIACGLAESRGAEGLVIAAHTGDHTIYPDCREEFMAAMADATSPTFAQVSALSTSTAPWPIFKMCGRCGRYCGSDSLSSSQCTRADSSPAT